LQGDDAAEADGHRPDLQHPFVARHDRDRSPPRSR
jgi:hypothetical protein